MSPAARTGDSPDDADWRARDDGGRETQERKNVIGVLTLPEFFGHPVLRRLMLC
jgi:hypothetical protein